MATTPYRQAAAFILALILSAGIIPLPSGASGQTSLRTLVQPGEKAPAFTLEDINGKRTAYRPAEGTPSMLVFWSAFCPLCREISPPLDIVRRRYAGRIRMVSVNLDGKRFSNAVRTFAKENAIDYPILLDSIRGDFFIASDPYGIEKTPTAVLVDARGKVRAAYPGESIRTMLDNFDAIASRLIDGKGVIK